MGIDDVSQHGHHIMWYVYNVREYKVQKVTRKPHRICVSCVLVRDKKVKNIKCSITLISLLLFFFVHRGNDAGLMWYMSIFVFLAHYKTLIELMFGNKNQENHTKWWQCWVRTKWTKNEKSSDKRRINKKSIRLYCIWNINVALTHRTCTGSMSCNL